MLNIQNLTVGFNLNSPLEKIVLKDFNLTVEDGEFIVILGSNGAGKSTLFNAILGSIPYNGNILLNNKNINALPQHKRAKKIGVVYQDPLRGTAPNLKVIDNIMLSTKKSFFIASKNIKEKAKEEIRSYGLGLENQFNLQAKSLSGGQRQALTLYMATNSSPELLLLDEHTAALDPHVQQIIMEVTDKIIKDKKITTLMITHNLKTALQYGNRLIILNEGKVVVDLKGNDKINATEQSLMDLYSTHFSDATIFKQE